MKFFLEYVSCFGPPNSVIKPAADRSLYAATVPVVHESCTSRRKHGRGRSGSSGDWRPALNAISEEKVVAVVVDIRGNRTATATGSDRTGKKRNVVAQSPKKIAQYHSLDDFRRAPHGAMIPTFSPTPFFF